MDHPTIYPQLLTNIRALESEYDQITEARKALLRRLGQYVNGPSSTAALNFICTHNSRRSQFSQIWATVAAHYFSLPKVQAFSGGTEVTAFFPSVGLALEELGFTVSRANTDQNPHYSIRFGSASPPLECYSKTFADPVNPQSDFAAIMTCSEADANCPFVPGAAMRLSLPYVDPKEADGTSEAPARYLETARTVGRELLFAFSTAR